MLNNIGKKVNLKISINGGALLVVLLVSPKWRLKRKVLKDLRLAIESIWVESII